MRPLILCVLALAPGCATTAPDLVGEPPHAPAPAPWETIASSRLGSPIEATTVGDGPLRILIIGAIHGNEAEALPAIEPLRRRLLDRPDAATVRIIRDINPDGTAAGTRGNARGVDLNRNWPTECFRPGRRHGPSPLSEPESAALHAHIRRFAPDIIIVLHSIPSGPFVNFDGPASEPADRFARAAGESDPRWHVRPSMGYPTPGSLGTWAGVERGIPILTVELARGHDPEDAEAAIIAGVLSLTTQADSASAAQNDSHPPSLAAGGWHK